MMPPEQKQSAEKALNHLFAGSQLDGVKFGPGPGSLLIRFEHYSHHSPDQIWLNIESRWGVFPKETTDYPASEADMRELSEEEEFKLVFELRREKVTAVRLGDRSPHLFMEFQSGKVLFVNGCHEKYECWQAGDGLGYSGDEWLIVACPGNGISIFAPNEFK